LLPDGSYEHLPPLDGVQAVNSQNGSPDGGTIEKDAMTVYSAITPSSSLQSAAHDAASFFQNLKPMSSLTIVNQELPCSRYPSTAASLHLVARHID
jgi:hypothetical protein